MKKSLFEPHYINKLNIKNRFVRSATNEGLADEEGYVTPKLVSLMSDLAKGEVGLIITGNAYVSPEGQSYPFQTAAHDNSHLTGLTEMVRAVHAEGGKIALQVVHAGKFSSQELTGQIPMGPSEDLCENDEICRAMNPNDISSVISAFTRAAELAKNAGFDAIQLHAAHGYLLGQFLSPAFNRRIDEYGGSLENRARLLLEIVGSVRGSVGVDYPILVKLNSDDFLDLGMTSDEAIAVALMLEKASVNSIELSGGTMASPYVHIPARPVMSKDRDSEVYYRETAECYKQQVTIPLMLVGGVRSYEVAEELIHRQTTDFVSLSRPLIKEPDLIKRWQKGDLSIAKCISCNGCFGTMATGTGTHCAIS